MAKRSYGQMMYPYVFQAARYTGRRLGDYVYTKYMKPKPKRSGIVGAPGVYAGVVKKAKPKKKNLYLLNGMEEMCQSGQIKSDPGHLTIGHGPAARKIVDVVAGAILKKLFRQAGVEIRDWGDNVVEATTLEIKLRFKFGPTSTIGTQIIAPTLALSYKELVKDLAEAMQNVADDTLLVDIVMNNTSANGDYRAMFNLQDCWIDLRGTSTLVIQNRTQPVAADNSTDDVRANPLMYKKYECTGNSFVPKADAVLAAPAVVATPEKGYIASTGVAGAKGFDTIEIFSNVKKTVNGGLNPGSVKKDYITWTFKGTFDQFYRKMTSYMNYSTLTVNATRRIMLGKSHVFEFERLCDTRQSEPDMTVGFEIVQTLSCIVYPRKAQTTPRILTDFGNTY